MPSLLCILSALVAFTAVHAQSVSSCPKFHIIVARASNTTNSDSATYYGPNEGGLAKTTNATCSLISGCTHYGIIYPGTPSPFSEYVKSETAGIKALHDAIISFNTACPKTPMAIFGYSQGAQVASDTLCGRSDKDFGGMNTAALTGPAADMIIATILFSDLAYVPAQLPYNIGSANSTETGVFSRSNVDACKPFDSGLRTYCDHGDTWCASAPNAPPGIAIHKAYVDKYTTPASKWVAYKYKQWLAAQ